MKKHLTPSLTTTKGNMTPLFFLDMILDTDFGLISLINKEFLDPHVFDKEKFKDLKISQLVKLLYTRSDFNPLVYFLRDSKKSEADLYYADIIKDPECYLKILIGSTETEMFYLIDLFSGESDISPTVLIRNKEEQKVWDSINPNPDKIKSIKVEDLNQSVMDRYFQIYCKYPENIQYLSKDLDLLMIDKTIYLANYSFNFVELQDDSQVTEKPLIDAISMRNQINVIDIYKKELLESEEDNSGNTKSD